MAAVQSPVSTANAAAAAPVPENLKTAVADVTTTEVPSRDTSPPTTVDQQQQGQQKTPNYLVASPYTEREHLLDLNTLDAENALLARALAGMDSVRGDYATAPYAESFNWARVMSELGRLAAADGHRWRETHFYVVVFRSQIPPTTVYADLGALDKVAHAEATASGGFLKYWFGTPDAEGRNLATCVWRSLEDARLGNVGPGHRKAAGATRALYTKWNIERLRLIVRDDVESWDIVDWAQ